MKKELGIFVILAVLCTALSIANPKFLSPVNLQNTARLIGMFGIYSIGVGFVIITGGIELSVGSVIALLGIIMSYTLTSWGWPWPVVAVSILLTGSCIGLFHGLMVTKVKMQPFIVTLCGLLIYRGIARFISRDSTRGFGSCEGFEAFRDLAIGELYGIPWPFFLLLVIGAITWLVLHHSVYGRYLFAVGRNEQAARYSGINTKLVITGAYVICGFLTGISGIILAFYSNAVQPSTHGNFYELFAIAAAAAQAGPSSPGAAPGLRDVRPAGRHFDSGRPFSGHRAPVAALWNRPHSPVANRDQRRAGPGAVPLGRSGHRWAGHCELGVPRWPRKWLVYARAAARRLLLEHTRPHHLQGAQCGEAHLGGRARYRGQYAPMGEGCGRSGRRHP